MRDLKKVYVYLICAMLCSFFANTVSANTAATASPLSIGTPVVDALTTGEVTKYYQFTLSQPGHVGMNFTHESNGSGNSYWQATVQSADGLTSYLFATIAGTATDTTKYVGLPAGTYLVKVTQGSYLGVSDYTLTINTTPGNFEQEKNDTVNTANVVDLGAAYTGNLETMTSGADVDYYKFTLSQPGYVGMNFKHEAIDSGSSYWESTVQSADGLKSFLTTSIAGTATDTTKYVGLPAGTYLVKVTQGSYRTDMDYTLTVTTGPGTYEQEKNDTIGSATPIALGIPYTGNLETLPSGFDVDYYKFTLSQPGYVGVNFKHEAISSGSSYWDSTVQSADGLTSYLTTGIAGTATDTTKYLGLPAGTYLVKVTQGSYKYGMDYTLTVTTTPGNYEQEKNESIGSATPISLGIPYTGNIETLPSGFDVDYYKFTLSQPGYVGVNFKHESISSSSSYWQTTVQSADGLTSFLTTGIAGTATDTTKYVGLPAGTYLVKVTQGSYKYDMDYTLTVTTTPGNFEQEKDDTVGSANPIALGTPYTGNLEDLPSGTDVDYYRFTLSEPGYVGVNFKHAPISNGSSYWQTAVQSADGLTSYLSTGIAGTATDTTKYVGLPAGTYLVKLTQGSYYTDMDYTLTVSSTLGNYEQEKNDTVGSANPIALGTSYSGNLEDLPSGSDVDYYKFTLSQPGYVGVNFKHAPISNGSSYWQTAVQSADGLTSYLTTGIAGTATDTTKYVGLPAGTYLVKLTQGSYYTDMDYTLTVSSTPGNYEQEQNGTVGGANLIALGTSYTGNLEDLPIGSDVDYYKFTLSQPCNVGLNFKHAPISNGSSYWQTTVQSADGLTSLLTTSVAGTAADSTKYLDLPAGTFLVKVTQGSYNTDMDYALTVTNTDAPVVTAFTLPATSNSLTVAITALSATDKVAVTGYLVSESATTPAASATLWSAAAPTAYTFADAVAGAHTLYAFAKDAAGNVSPPLSATVIIPFTLTVQLKGAGSGTVNSNPAGIACASGSISGCSAGFSTGSVELTAVPSAGSIFVGWSGSCEGSPCSVLMDSSQTVGATFTLGAAVKICDTSYPDLQKAFDAALDGDVIKMKEGVLTGSLIGNRDVHVIIIGGYQADYSGVTGETTIEGKITLQKGSVKTSGVNLK